MHHRPCSALLLALLLLLAGCNGLPPPESAASPTATSTAVEIPSASPTGFPPGVTGVGIAEPFTLSEAHARELNRSYTVRQETAIRFTNGTLYTSDTSTTRIGESRTRYTYTVTVRGSGPNFLGGGNGTLTAHSNGTAVLRRIQTDDTTSYGVYTTPDGELIPPTSVNHGTPRNTERIATLFGHVQNTSVTRQGDGSFVIQATALGSDTLEIDGGSIQNVTNPTFTATLTAPGLVQQYELRFNGTLNGDSVTVQEHVRYRDLGSTTVAQPAWYDTAENATT